MGSFRAGFADGSNAWNASFSSFVEHVHFIYGLHAKFHQQLLLSKGTKQTWGNWDPTPRSFAICPLRPKKQNHKYVFKPSGEYMPFHQTPIWGTCEFIGRYFLQPYQMSQ